MAKEFRFDEGRREGRAIERYQRPLPPRREVMQSSNREFFSGSALTDEQHGPVDPSYARQPLLELQKDFGLPQSFLFANIRWY